MKLLLTISPFEAKNMNRPKIIAALASGLGIKRQVAALRLDRALSSGTESLRRDVLAELFRLADSLDIDRQELLRLESKSLFDVLPKEATLLYLGAYGPVDAQTLAYVDNITVSVTDYRSARLFAQCVTRDSSRLRFAPSVSGEEEAVVGNLEKLSAEAEGMSIISIGSSKINTMSEWLTAAALELTPFRERAASQPRPPVELVYAHSDVRPRLHRRESTRCNARFRPASEIGQSYLIWNEHEYRYALPDESVRGGKAAMRGSARECDVGDLGDDYAVVLIETLSPTKGNVVIAGLRAGATLGASALMCRDSTRFALPSTHPDVRLFLVQVKVGAGVHFCEPVAARVVEHWTKSSRRYANPEDREFGSLGMVSLGLEAAT